jgi:hypothetical protein
MDRQFEPPAPNEAWVADITCMPTRKAWVWWSRLAQPRMHAWTEGPPRKVQLLKADEDDPDPDAICCYGLLRHDSGRVMVRFVEDRPVGDFTTQFLLWAWEVVPQNGKKVLIIVWDEASGTGPMGYSPLGEQAQRARAAGRESEVGDLRTASGQSSAQQHRALLDACEEGHHGADRKLTAQRITSRVCDHFGCEMLPYLKSQDASETVEVNPRQVGP